MQVKDQSMDNGELIPVVALLNSGSLDDVPAGLDHIELNQSVVSLTLIGNSVKLLLVQAVDVADVAEPGVQQSQISGGQGSLDTTTVVVATDNDMLDSQVSHGIVDDGHDVEIDIGDQVGDIAVDEDLACLQAHDLIGWDTAVTASNISVSR